MTCAGQSQNLNEPVSFTKLIEHFKKTLHWNEFFGQKNDTVTKYSLYKTNEFNVSISDNPVNFSIGQKTLKNPNFSNKWDEDEDKYTMNYPISFSVIYKNNLIALFEKGRFVCYDLGAIQRNLTLEKMLNEKKFQYHWIIDNKLVALRGNSLFSWNDQKWVKFKKTIPLDKQPKLFEDEDYIVFGDCFGEWGGTVYFFDKATKKTFFTESTCSNTVFHENEKYFVLANLGHMTGSSELKMISDPRKLTIAKKEEINKRSNGEALGYQDNSNECKKIVELFGIQVCSVFKFGKRQVFLVSLNNLTFLAEIKDNNIQIIHPLFDNDISVGDAITSNYGHYTLINLSSYGIALEREVSCMIIKGNNIIKIDWNENHTSK